MAQTYTRQSTFADGDTITAALFNDEYNQLVNAFAYSSSSASSTGHRHDGTAGQGGNIHTIGDLDFLNKIVVDSTNNRWGFYVEVSSAAVEQIRLQDGALLPVTDSDVDLGTSSLYFKDAYIDSITTTGNVAVGGNLTVTGTTTFNGGTITMGDAATDNVVFGADVDSSIIPDDDDTYDLGSSSQQWRNIFIDGTAEIDTLALDGTTVTSTAAELNILDGVTSTAAELNILDGVTSTTAELNILDGVTATAAELNLVDGGTSRGTTAVANGDGFLHNDGGTMRMTNVSKMADLFAGTGISASNAVLSIDAAQTGITSLLATDIKIGEDDQTKIDFETANKIHFYADNAKQVVIEDGAILPGTDNDIDLGASGTEFKDAFFDGTVTTDALVVGGNTTVQNILAGTTANTIQFEGSTADDHETTLGVIDPTGDRTINLPNVSGTLPVLAAASTDQITATPAELNVLDGITATVSELNIMDGVTATTSELNIMDGVTSTTAELNLMDGGTSATSTTLASADRFVCNDNGTMKQVALSDLVTYLEDGGTSGFNVDGGTYS